jgi:hypothetical protein
MSIPILIRTVESAKNSSTPCGRDENNSAMPTSILSLRGLAGKSPSDLLGKRRIGTAVSALFDGNISVGQTFPIDVGGRSDTTSTPSLDLSGCGDGFAAQRG